MSFILANSIKDNKCSTSMENNELKPPEIVLRRTQSFESDEKFVSYIIFCILFFVRKLFSQCAFKLFNLSVLINSN